MSEDTGSAALPDLSGVVADFIESGVSIIVGVAGTDGRAHAGRALASRVVAPDTIRVILTAEGNGAIEASAAREGSIAVTFCAPVSHRTIQIKGRTSKIEEIGPEDLSAAETQSRVFGEVLSSVGHSPDFARVISDYQPSALRVISFQAHEAFEQTPGPGAGRAI